MVADAAHSLGALHKGLRSGQAADFTNFSFHAVKNLTTGEGGAVTWRDLEGLDNDWLYREFQLYSLHGQSKDAYAKNQSSSWEYDIVRTGYKYNMTDIMAGIGLKQLERYPGMLERRREIVRRYDEAFLPYGIERLVHVDDISVSSHHLYLARVPEWGLEQRNAAISQMAERGVACNVHYKPLPMMTAYKNLGFDIYNYPNAYAQYVNEITLPLYSKLSDEEVGYILDSFSSILKRSGL